MMSDDDLIKFAAIAAEVDSYSLYDTIGDHGEIEEYGWNPLSSDGDALRLAVKLNVELSCYIPHIVCTYDKNGTVKQLVEKIKDDRYAATRRAIVRAAAEIGKAM